MDEKKCSFCGAKLAQGTGKMLVKKDGSTLFFCSGRCEKNVIKLKRTPRKVKWISKKKKTE
ncbi:MAG TPA: 50S ribosomal protein L24e [Nitrospirae bacterium]|nr:50S ribosomal protein L24e [archaeon BMS3Abin16]GBE56004.1 50S ribosomal protein L24e [archaeon BMS3Bbin16]HDH00955.1 50S ribosomal protein L24e [Nitrospirota bacterium]HDH27588.1 50S ribosomal protein L24e [Euryarchaeota archaeon]